MTIANELTGVPLMTTAKRLIGYLLVLALVFISGWFSGGRSANGDVQAKYIDTAIDSALWQSQAQMDEAALAEVKQLLDKQKNDLAAAKRTASEAIAQRTAVQKQLNAERDTRKQALEKTANENPDCAALAGVLCPAVARRLFGSPAGPTDTE
ncbi:hypothetical protein L2Y94_06555 [Luteibacter aegosomatis]|uniref:hypothetical protein n=1 Tax=Luteibacter aegosomatis TaxID=2911537 RepID=UPI001FFA4EDF|nr:hypothetical protein [Luteibacter aegosomatis]UPG87012.1 hypothetical protein L2Y94_06555 [Luteibacter aegosomatis]